MQSVFVTITKLVASQNYFCKEGFGNDFGRDGRVIFRRDFWLQKGLGKNAPRIN